MMRRTIDGWFVDEHGYPVGSHRIGPAPDADLQRRDPPRQKSAYPYGYCPFTIWGFPGENKECNGTVYVDRMEQWDRAKYVRLAAEIFVDDRGARVGVYNSHACRGDLIEKFLRAWNEDPDLALLRVVECCNVATGYPTWALYYRGTK